MTSIPGVDYAWSHPGGAALKAAGQRFAARYLSTDTSKNLTKAEAADLAAHGIASVVVWETTAKRALAGKTAGATDAKTASALAAACGMPGDRPIYFAVDFDATPTQQTAINAYLDGAASVIGRARVGIYGGYYPVKRALDADKATWAWQTIAWSGGQWDARAHIRQGAQATIGGVDCDLNTATRDDYGQWSPGKAPAHPVVDLSQLVTAAKTDPKAVQGHQTYAAGVRLVEAALKAESLLGGAYAGDGSYGTTTVAAYAAWQRRCGYSGKDADGIPGQTTLKRLGTAHGFTVTA